MTVCAYGCFLCRRTDARFRKDMKKLAKRSLSAVLAVVMAASIAVSTNAANECNHPMATRQRTGFANHFYTTHLIPVYGANGTVIRDEACSISGTIYYCSYVCVQCNAIVGSAGTETVTVHGHPACKR